MAATRIYYVADGHETRLIDATSAAAAIRHCAVRRYRYGVAKPKQIADLMASGIRVEQATGDAQADETTDQMKG